jgi:multidrug efflux pump subunit AcrA (membrane-fusion protein)
LIALLLVALVGLWKARNYQRRYTASEARKASLPIPVGAAQAKIRKLETTVGAAGQVLQYTTVTLTSRISAKIQKVLVNVGDIIQSGAVLIEDDRKPLEVALEYAQAEVESTRVAEQKAAAELKSMEVLKAKKMATEKEVNDARVTLASKQAALQEANVKLIKAQLDLEATRLTSPVNGIVLARFVNSDERVEAIWTRSTCWPRCRTSPSAASVMDSQPRYSFQHTRPPHSRARSSTSIPASTQRLGLSRLT